MYKIIGYVYIEDERYFKINPDIKKFSGYDEVIDFLQEAGAKHYLFSLIEVEDDTD